MKANAPEKIQVHLVKNDYDDWSIEGYSFLSDKQLGMTEYTRTDALIDKVSEWLKDNASNYIINTTPSYPDADFSAFVGGKCWEDLKQAMKDE